MQHDLCLLRSTKRKGVAQREVYAGVLDVLQKYVILLDHKGNKLFLEKYFFTSFGDQLHHQKKWVANGWVGELYTGMTENNNMLLVESKSWCQI